VLPFEFPPLTHTDWLVAPSSQDEKLFPFEVAGAVNRMACV